MKQKILLRLFVALFSVSLLFSNIELQAQTSDRNDSVLINSDRNDDGVVTSDQNDTAQGSSGTVSIENPLAADNITEFFLLIIEILLIFAIPLIVLFIIYAGFLMVTAQGNEEQLKTAKRALIYAVIGGLLILGAQLILQVIQGTVAALQSGS